MFFGELVVVYLSDSYSSVRIIIVKTNFRYLTQIICPLYYNFVICDFNHLFNLFND